MKKYSNTFTLNVEHGKNLHIRTNTVEQNYEDAKENSDQNHKNLQ